MLDQDTDSPVTHLYNLGGWLKMGSSLLQLILVSSSETKYRACRMLLLWRHICEGLNNSWTDALAHGLDLLPRTQLIQLTLLH